MKLKSKLALTALLCCMMGMLSACGGSSVSQASSASADQATLSASDGATLTVVTNYAGTVDNADNFQDAAAAWEQETGYTIDDQSESSSEAFKAKIVDEFEEGTEPDVLFFFTGADANTLIESGKVVSIDTIRESYPEYASNMDDSLLPASIVDGDKYAVPVNGYWEALYYNRDILKAAGVDEPGTDYTMDQFLADCAQIKEAGYTPIAAALGNTPHYWWEYMIFNEQSPATHDMIPDSVTDELGKEWVAGLTTIKEIYEAGYFPDSTLSIDNSTSVETFTSGEAAFVIDGSWRTATIVKSCQTDPDDPSTLDEDALAKFGVGYVPGNGDRAATDIIGGISQGYYISTAAYNDPVKRDAAVSFVEYMTSDEIVNKFASHTITALKDQTRDVSGLNFLQQEGIAMTQGATSITPALQDLYQGDCRVSTFDGLPELVTGVRDIADAVSEGLDIYHNEQE